MTMRYTNRRFTYLLTYKLQKLLIVCDMNRDKHEEQHRPALHKVLTGLSVSVWTLECPSVCLSVQVSICLSVYLLQLLLN